MPQPQQLGLCPRTKRWIDWADLLKRVWAWEVLACACGGTRRVLAAIPAGPIAEKILKHLKLPSAPQVPARARLAAQTELWDTAQPEPWDTGPPAYDDSQAPTAGEFEFDQRLAESEFPD